MIPGSMDLVEEAKFISAKEQPRRAVNDSDRCSLPRAEPLHQQQSALLQALHKDCRLLIWGHVLRPSQTRIERWRIPNRSAWVSPEESDADCFPYRITAAEWGRSEKPLNLLLCCRQLYLEGLAILYSTTFIFEMPLDLYNFQICVSPEGLLNVKRLIIAFGKTDWSDTGPFFSRDHLKHPQGSLSEWEDAIHGLKKMRGLQELQIWLGHHNVQMPELERRPWKQSQGNQMLEGRHQKLFDLLSTVQIPNFTIHLTWKPEDLLSQRVWPFDIKLHTKDKMCHIVDEELPWKTVPNLLAW